MTDGWFAGLDPDEEAETARRVHDGDADAPADWPRLAVESGFVAGSDTYYDRLHGATLRATREAVRERERADDQQLVRAIRARDDKARNLL